MSGRLKLIVAVVGLLLSCLAGTADAAEPVRTYVLTGQGGEWMATGMEKLAGSLRGMDSRLRVSTHSWEKHREIAKDIGKLPPETPVVIIGYSLGANAATWIAGAVAPRGIDLIVAYDPTERADVKRTGNNVKRVLLYRNDSIEPWGHGRIPGAQVETTETRNSHLAVSHSNWLHGKTRAAVERVLEETRPRP